MIYFRAGLYAEGPTDYHFLLPLLDRMLDELAAPLFPSRYEVGTAVGIDAPLPAQSGRAERIAAAIHERWSECTVFVVHEDGAGDPEAARTHCINPGLALARATRPERRIAAAACVPLRETEAWMLVDIDVFRDLLGRSTTLALPGDPESELDPKLTLRRILREGKHGRAPERLYAYFGERVRLDLLRRLSAFQHFEAELRAAMLDAARYQGHAPVELHR